MSVVALHGNGLGLYAVGPSSRYVGMLDVLGFFSIDLGPTTRPVGERACFFIVGNYNHRYHSNNGFITL